VGSRRPPSAGQHAVPASQSFRAMQGLVRRCSHPSGHSGPPVFAFGYAVTSRPESSRNLTHRRLSGIQADARRSGFRLRRNDGEANSSKSAFPCCLGIGKALPLPRSHSVLCTRLARRCPCPTAIPCYAQDWQGVAPTPAVIPGNAQDWRGAAPTPAVIPGRPSFRLRPSGFAGTGAFGYAVTSRPESSRNVDNPMSLCRFLQEERAQRSISAAAMAPAWRATSLPR
jgi:hypothetical protein